MDRPKTVFKYEPFSLRSLQNLKASSVYFGSPGGFNDPYDCALNATIAEPSHDEIGKLKEAAFTQRSYPQDVLDQIHNISNDEFVSRTIAGAQLIVDNARDEFLEKRGATCFSEVNDNLLMWSHYGGQYKGYCLSLIHI